MSAKRGAVMEAKEMERLWSRHLEAEFATKDAEAALETMVEDPCNRRVYLTF
jgi:hypothetical protein